MKHYKIKALCIVTSILLMSCRIALQNEDIAFVNKAKYKIVFQPHILISDLQNEDRVFQCQKIVFGVGSDTLLYLPAGTHSDWESNLSGNSFLNILIFDAETFDSYITAPCDTIRKYVPVLQLYQLTLKDMQLLNWTVTYPPTDVMKNMKIYPSYKEKNNR